MKKKPKSTRTHQTGKDQIDVLFKILREKYNIYAFQNETSTRIKFLEEFATFPLIITKYPKRDCFIPGSDNVLVKEGLGIFYRNLSPEQYETLKLEIYKKFKQTYFIRSIKDDTRKNNNKSENFLNGIFLLQNIQVRQPE